MMKGRFRYQAINSLKVKILVEGDDLYLPDILALGPSEIKFSAPLEDKNAKRLKKITVMLFSIGKWNEYEAEDVSIDEKNPHVLLLNLNEEIKKKFNKDFMLARC